MHGDGARCRAHHGSAVSLAYVAGALPCPSRGTYRRPPSAPPYVTGTNYC